MLNTAVWDVETKYYTDSPYDAELSSISVIFTDDNKFRFYDGDDDTIAEGVRSLLKAKRICGFNSHLFDVPTVLKYLTREEGRKLRMIPHLDFYHEYTQQKSGQRISLYNMSKSTLGPWDCKMELWNDTAISLYRNNPMKLMAYNNWDVKVTFRLLQYLHTFGYVWYTAPMRQRLHIPNWSPILWDR